MSEQDETQTTQEPRRWVCPDCGNEEDRHHSSKTRPFCDACDWQHAVAIEMCPEGPGKERFLEYGGEL